ncbi:unnamed protein product [Adineta ricciae]|uniref:Uncharacterized protein n=1 Tax=Adineta ricciae TaxID=249248 RepID=A0A815BLD5_ADIRI|nr:unnamed protein product [Adineta ricciae]
MLQEVTSLPALVSLTIKPGKLDNLSERLAMLLSSVIARSNLRKLSLYAMCEYISKISGSKQCKLKELFIDSCSHNHVCHILDRLPNLQTFSTRDYRLPMSETPIVLTSIHLLTSLKLYCMQIPIGLLESLLSYMPALVHLHLSTYFTTFYFLQRLSQWESFIREKLPVLNTFKLYASTEQYQYLDVKDIESMLNRFRTPFWLELKRWYITCEYVKDGNTSNIRLYSRKDSHRNFPAKSSPAMLTHSASTTRNDDITDMSIKWKVRLNLLLMTAVAISQQISIQPMFRCMTHLVLDIDQPIAISSYQFLSEFADYSQLTEIWLILISPHHSFQSDAMDNILNLVGNVPTVGISYTNDPTLIPKDILDAIISHQVKHLIIRTIYEECMQSVVTYARQLTTITFVRDQCSSNAWTHMTRWLDKNGNKYSVKDDSRSLCVYFE